MNGRYQMKIVRFEEISSTNDYVKEQKSLGENLIVIAKRQTGGKGTKGRSFSSNEGGVYLTKLVFYDNFPADKVFLVMARTAVAVCKTLESFSLKPVIKWANDVFVNGRKICGILIENSFSGKNISSSIIGVGLNVNNPLPEELSSIAISMREALMSSSERIPTELSLGRICASPSVSCPPAIPPIVSGERIDSESIRLLLYYGIDEIDVIK